MEYKGARRMLIDRTRKPNGFTITELAAITAAAALLLVLTLPVLAQLRGDEYRSVTADHLRQYGRAHLTYVADHGVLPMLGGYGGAPASDAWVTEVGVFDTDHNGLVIDVEEAAERLMNGFVDNYVTDPMIFTSPADSLERYTDPAIDNYGRLGNFLVPDEDPRAVGATFSRLWFNAMSSEKPRGYSQVGRTVYVDVGGIIESYEMSFQRTDSIESPADCADIVEEDEESMLNNSLFTNYVPDYPFDPGTGNLITDRHPGNGGHVSYHDGHVELLTDIVSRYWQEPDDDERLRLLWQLVSRVSQP